jgi:hypothetical protein
MAIHNSSKSLLQIFGGVNYFIIDENPQYQTFLRPFGSPDKGHKKTGRKARFFDLIVPPRTCLLHRPDNVRNR